MFGRVWWGGNRKKSELTCNDRGEGGGQILAVSHVTFNNNNNNMCEQDSFIVGAGGFETYGVDATPYIYT